MILLGIFKLQPMRPIQGVFSVLRGAIEVATTPIAWLLKPITRGITTVIVGMPKIENNHSFQKLVEKGKQFVTEHVENKDVTNEDIFAARVLCTDISRKLKKSIKRGQKSDVVSTSEYATYRATIAPKGIAEEDSTDNESSAQFTLKINKYLTLFAPKRPGSMNQSNPIEDFSNINRL